MCVDLNQGRHKGLEEVGSGITSSILEGRDEILTVIRLGVPHEFQRRHRQRPGSFCRGNQSQLIYVKALICDCVLVVTLLTDTPIPNGSIHLMLTNSPSRERRGLSFLDDSARLPQSLAVKRSGEVRRRSAKATTGPWLYPTAIGRLSESVYGMTSGVQTLANEIGAHNWQAKS